MPPPGRRSIPDNLDPLVDTLSNVVGILVIVVVLTQLQLGDAISRVAEVDLLRTREEHARALIPAEAEALGVRREALIRRTDLDLSESIVLAEELLTTLSETERLRGADESGPSLVDLRETLAKSRVALAEQTAASDRRDRYAVHLEKVPKRMVARLPDPTVIQGKESWILVRGGRVYLTDRQALFERGQEAIGRVLGVGADDRFFRPDEWESVARYLRKREIGDGTFRWNLKTEAGNQIELRLENPDRGLEFPGLAESRALRQWLSIRSPDVDLILFHVWNDSFEAYLAAREVIEAAGFRAGWRGYDATDELDLPIRMGRPTPEVRPILVD